MKKKKKKKKQKIIDKLLVSSIFASSALGFFSLKTDLSNYVESRRVEKFFEVDKYDEKKVNDLIVDINKKVMDLTNDSKTFEINALTDEEKLNYLLLKAIIENKNLDDLEKKTMLGYYELFNDIDELDRKFLYNQFLKLNTFEEDEWQTKMVTLLLYGNDEKANKNLLAFHWGDAIYYVSKKEKMIIAHEAAHHIFPLDNIPIALNEGTMEIIAHEYISDKPFGGYVGYSKESLVSKILCDLVGREIYLKSFVLDDMKYIEEGLTGIAGTLEDAKGLTTSLKEAYVNDIGEKLFFYVQNKVRQTDDLVLSERLQLNLNYFVNDEYYNDYNYYFRTNPPKEKSKVLVKE